MSAAINVRRLESELAVALEADQRYQRENDAKFRAVHQKVATYEEFRDIVKAAHLSPLEHKNIVGGSVKQPWNSVAAGGGAGVAAGGNRGECMTERKLPTTSQEFTREWRRLTDTSAEQYHLLMRLPMEQLSSMLTVDASLMGGVIAVLKEHYQDNDANKVVAILTCLSESPRLRLAIDFLSHTERKTLQQLLLKP